ncbi:MAG: hypothetical protein JWP95_354 [Actinotalea sp.]|nr:hypothetical protein [Actinotalea sp.]
MSSSSPATPSRVPAAGRPAWHRWAALAVALLVVVVLALLLRPSGGSADDAVAGATESATPTTSEDATPDPSEPAGGPTATPDATEPADPGDDDPADPADPAAPQDPAVRPTAAPVPLEQEAEPTSGVRVGVAQIEAVQGEANVPGEVGGPSLRVTVSVTNGTTSELSLSSAVVNLYHGSDMAPAIELLEPGRTELPASVAPGEVATGVFVFLVPEDRRDAVTVEFDLSAGATVVIFSGPVGV